MQRGVDTSLKSIKKAVQHPEVGGSILHSTSDRGQSEPESASRRAFPDEISKDGFASLVRIL